MRRLKKYIILLFIVVVVLGLIYGYKQYNLKPADLTNKVADITTTATNIITDYDTNEAVANKKYLGKTVQVTGIISAINNQQDTSISISLGDDMHKVACEFNKKYINSVKQYQPNTPITIKGICTGYLLDVEMNRCVVVK
jgi:hypothetical protein